MKSASPEGPRTSVQANGPAPRIGTTSVIEAPLPSPRRPRGAPTRRARGAGARAPTRRARARPEEQRLMRHDREADAKKKSASSRAIAGTRARRASSARRRKRAIARARRPRSRPRRSRPRSPSRRARSRPRRRRPEDPTPRTRSQRRPEPAAAEHRGERVHAERDPPEGIAAARRARRSQSA